MIEDDESQRERVCLYCTGALCELERVGLVELAGHRLSPRGVAAWDQLRASGFRPSETEIYGYLSESCPRLTFEAGVGLARLVTDLDRVLAERETEATSQGEEAA